MSVDYNKFVGPYLKVNNPKVARKETVTSCTNNGCELWGEVGPHSTKKFCPECGSKIGDVQVDSEGGLDFDVYEETGGNLHEPGEMDNGNDMVLLSNLTSAPGTDIGDEEVFDITPATIQADLAKFSKLHAKDIAKVIRVFGAKNVEVKYGVVAYTS